MFESLQERLSKTVRNLQGKGQISEDNVKDSMREVRMALLEADVALPVVKEFTQKVKERAIGTEVLKSVSPGQAFVKIVHDELIAAMGGENDALNLAAQPPVVVMVAGLQGAGKTTSIAKLSRWLREKQNKSVLTVSCDVYRPAAIEQLKTLSSEVEVDFFPSQIDQLPVTIAKNAVEHARKKMIDVVLVDTAGRLHIDADMMDEAKNIHTAIQPTETLFVVDSMTGQDAANTAKAFNDALPLTGVILTKTDGDARGGAALSIRHLTGKPIKFIGSGEKTTALEPFFPDRIASRILDMGDVVSLVEQVQDKIDQDKATKLAKKLSKGKKFTLQDFRDQLDQLQNMGGLGSFMDKLPGMSQVPDKVKDQVNDKDIKRQIAIINSMTKQERRFPDVIKASRKKRIAAGSGVQVQDVNRLLKQFTQMERMMKKLSKGGMAKMMRSMKGQMPPGMGF